MKTFNWILDTQIIKDSQLQQISSALNNIGIKFMEVNLKNNATLNVDTNTIYIPYGTTHLVKECLKDISNYHIYFNEDNFSPQKWNKELNTLMLNFVN